MCNKKGFSLLSFLLYLMLFSLITCCMCQIVTVLIIPSFAHMRQIQSLIELHIASDFFVRDIRTMREGRCIWKKMLPHELIWQKGDCDIGWRFSQDRLERREGQYNERWQGATTSIITKGLSDAIFNVEKDKNHIIGIELILTSLNERNKPIVCYVAVKNQGKINENP